MQIVEFDENDARTAADIRLNLSRAGTPIGSYDLLIAAQAMRHDLTVVTANVREFSRVPNLRWESLTASSKRGSGMPATFIASDSPTK